MSSTNILLRDPALDPGVISALRELFAAASVAFNGFVARINNRAEPIRASLTAAQEAEAVRAMADQYVTSDPRFADDLYAAADRHERAAV